MYFNMLLREAQYYTKSSGRRESNLFMPGYKLHMLITMRKRHFDFPEKL